METPTKKPGHRGIEEAESFDHFHSAVLRRPHHPRRTPDVLGKQIPRLLAALSGSENQRRVAESQLLIYDTNKNKT